VRVLVQSERKFTPLFPESNIGSTIPPQVSGIIASRPSADGIVRVDAKGDEQMRDRCTSEQPRRSVGRALGSAVALALCAASLAATTLSPRVTSPVGLPRAPHALASVTAWTPPPSRALPEHPAPKILPRVAAAEVRARITWTPPVAATIPARFAFATRGPSTSAPPDLTNAYLVHSSKASRTRGQPVQA